MSGEKPTEGDLFGVAIVGMAGRFPGAPDLDAFWRNLRGGVESIRFFDDDELRAAGVPPELIEHPRYVKAGSVLEDIDHFDARFFGYGPGEAALIDPQQRLLLETAWWALENAGYDAKAFDGPIGVFAGSTLSSYLLHLAMHGGPVSSASAGPAFMGNSPDFLATRVAYKLDLQGPAYSVHTACSTSLVAVHLACQALLGYETDVALAGGVSVRVPHQAGYLSEESGITSPDGHTRPFDAAGRGTVFGNGVGLVVLRRLEDALAAGDRVLAVIRGSATNNDGSVKVGFTAPSLGAQSRVIAEALAAADVDPATVSYVEAHGTGTELGDPIEVAALTRAFGASAGPVGADRSRPCALGSVKSNIGHLDAAAGISGLIKAVLMLRHREIPPSLHFETPNPKIDFAGSPFEVVTAGRPWTSDGGPLRAGVSSFGFGGTNVHLVLEEAPAPAARAASPPEREQLWLLSARTGTALAASSAQLADHLVANADLDPADAAFTLQVGRRALEERRAVVAAGREAAALALRDGQGFAGRCDRDDPPVIFLFSGQGSQYAGMGRQLYRDEPVYRQWIDRAAEVFAGGETGDGAPFDLHAVLTEADDDALRRTDRAQPALFAVEHALARLWMSWGIRPAAVLGHSIGEIAAAVIAGYLPFEAAARMVVERGRAMEACEPGAMLAVALPEDAVTERLAGTGLALEIAVVNGPAAVVVSGSADEIDAFVEQLTGEEIDARRLHTSHAFHSRAMEPAASALASYLATQDLASPTPEAERVPLISNLTGRWMAEGAAASADYWARQIRQPVRFGAGLETALTEHEGILLEIGPGDALGTLARRHPATRTAARPEDGGDRPILSSLRHARRNESDRAVMLGSLGRLWVAGCRPDWQAVDGGDPRRVALPGYPFERQSYWVGGKPSVAAARETSSEAPAPVVAHQRPELARAFEAPRSPAEETLAQLWGELLGLTGVGRHDDFFELGGDSLIATRMLARLQDRLGAAIPLDQLFASPTVAGLAAELPAPTVGEAAALGIPTVDRSGELPLSFAQQRLWFLAHLDPTGAAYNLPGTMRLRGALDIDLLVAALAAAVERHESLRTRFIGDAGRPRQEILPTAVIPFQQRQVSGEGDPLERALEVAAEDARQPFDLSQAPLGRALLIRLGPDDHLFQLTLHHIVSDGWSWNVLRRELAEFVATAGVSTIEPPPIQYADFAAWQRSDEGGAHLAQELAFWRQRLTPTPPVLDLPTDRPRPAEQSYRGATLSFRLGGDRVAALEALARERGATLFMILLSAFEVLLSRYSHQRSFAVGTPVANRRRSELEGIVGLFVNSLVLRADLQSDAAGEPTFEALLERSKEDALAAFAHQDIPFERLVDELVEERSLGHSPLFQVMFGLHNTPPAGEIPGLAVEVLEPDTGTAKLDLTMGLLVADEGLEGTLEYSTDLFDRASIERLLGAFRVLLDGVIDDPSRALLELPLMTPAERQQVVEGWNRTAKPRPRDATLHGLVEAQAERTPEAVALLFEGREMTYRQLDERAEALADRLAAAGVRPESRVGIHLERSLDLLVSLLAVLKAGGAWVPLTPDNPPARLVDMVEQASVATVLSSAPAEESREIFGSEVTVLVPAAAESASPRRRSPVDPDQLAYVVFTSGSTGHPKGAMNSHRAILNRLLWMLDHFDLQGGDRVLQKTPISFDVSVWELFWPLLTGATLVIARPGGHRDSSYLIERIVDDRLTAVHFVPSMLQAFLEDPEVARCNGLRWVICSGEALPFDLEQRFFERLPGVELHNLYGPTEAAVEVSYWPCAPAAKRRPVPIGWPIDNVRLYLLDSAFRPVSPGVAGELWIGGAAPARGYVGQPALTADRFRPDPLTTDAPGARLYRTGDVARHLPDGAIDYLGRVDHQVKVRGFRIELGEIEAVLTEHPAVREAAVLARTEGPSVRLVAYWTPTRQGSSTEAAELQAHLAASLPEHMLPAAFMMLDEFPLNPNGKLDRRALPAPDWGVRASGDSGVPSTPAEIALAAVWEEVLGVEGIGPRDNFFTLGGDSIISLQVVARASAVGLRIDTRAVFQHQTLGALAAAADADSSSHSRAEQGPVVGPFELLPMQRWFLDRPPAQADHWNQSVMLEPRQAIDLDAWNAALGDLLRHHDALRGRFRPSDEGAWTGHLAEPTDERPTTTVFEGSDEDLLAAQTAVQGSLDLADGPLLASALFASETSQRLLLVIHHLAVDGVSWRILLEDLARAYEARRAGETPTFPPKTSSVKAWGAAVAELPPWSAAELSFWTAQEQAADPLTAIRSSARDAGEARNLQSEGDVAGDVEGGGDLVEGFLDVEETADLVGRLAGALRARPDEIVLAAVVEVLRRRGSLESLRVDIEGHGRDLPLAEGIDLSRTVGWFTALYPLRFDLADVADDEASTSETVGRVKAVTRRVPHGGAGYGARRFGSGEERVAAPLVFNYLGRLDGLVPEGSPFRPTAEGTGPDRAAAGARPYPFEINAALFENRLRIAWSYGRRGWPTEIVESLMAETLGELRAMLAEEEPRPCWTAAEFPLADLDEDGLRQVLRSMPVDRSGTSRVPRDLYRLTPVQEGMLFQTLFQAGEGGSEGVFVEQLTCELADALDLDRFRAAWSAVQQRHPALTTSFLWEGLDQPLQVVTEPHPAEVVVLEGEDEDAFLAADRRRGFDLTQPPLQRWTLLRRGTDGEQSGGSQSGGSYLFVWTFHHLILDGWSAARVLAEVLELYGGEEAGKLPPVAPFRGYLAWLAERRGGRDGEAATDFWRQELDGLQAPTPLGIDRTALQGRKGVGRRLAEIILPAELAEGLAAAGRRHHLTLATLLQAAWARVLSTYSGQQDVVFGATVAGRPADLPGVESMVGLFINSLPVRLEVPATGGIVEWLTDVQERAIARRPHEHVALGRVQNLSGLPAGEPLYESLLVIENYPFDDTLLEAGGLALGAPRFLEQTNEPLALMATPGEEFILRLAWDRTRIPDDAGRRVLDHLRQVLRGLVDALTSDETQGADEDDTVRPIDLDLLSPDDRHRMLVEWNDLNRSLHQFSAAKPEERLPSRYQDGEKTELGGEGYDASGLLQDRAEYWARETPDEIAVVGDGETLTYGELDELANRLAWRLKDLGVGPDVAVGISMERTPRLVAALHGILKAGGAYLPLDPAYPAERKAAMLAQAEAPVLVTERSLADTLEGPRIVLIEELTESDTSEAGKTVAPFPCPATSENLAYVIYTSGSTGRPKGVMIPHRGVVNRLAYAPWIGHLRPGDRYIHKASLGFDVSVLEIFLPLYAGGRVVMARPGGHQDPAYLAEVMRREGVHQGIFTPSLLRLLLDEEDFAACDTLHSVVSGAEALPPELVERFYDRTAAVLSNRYGPTEASIAASSWDCEPGVEELRVPIGRPIARALLYVVDRHLRPLPPGVPGELVIGGPGLARGYLARPGLTAELFVPNPFPVPNSVGGERLYRTGDRVCIRPAGAVEFLGRLDYQVKIRGHRVEPGEIEAALEDLETVRRAVVIDQRDPAGTLRLVAYLEAEGTEPTAEELRQVLGQRLPDYMVPAAFVVLDALPLNTNGKVDRGKLPDPSFDRADSGRAFVAPRTPAEQALTAVMEEVLGVERVGVEDDFFELGGDSILSIRVVSKARQVGYELNVRQIFEERTVGRLSRVAGEAAAEARAEQGPVTGEASLTPVMARFFERPIPQPHWFNQALLLDLREDVPAERLHRALSALVEHHDALRLRYESNDGEWRQWIAPVDDAALAFEIVDLADADAEAAAGCTAERCAAAQRSLDLAAGPLVSAVYFSSNGARPTRLLLAVHHLAVDGFSWRVLAEDLETACRQLAQSEELRLPLKTTSFKAWAEGLHGAANGGAFDGERNYWQQQVADAAGEGQDFGLVGEAEQVELRLSAADTAALVEEVPKAFDTGVDHAVLAAIGGVLQGDGPAPLRVALEGHGRDALATARPELDVSRTVGWFTTVYPVALDLSDAVAPLDRLVRVKEILRRVPSGGAGYGALRYLTNGGAGVDDLAVAPAPVLFNYLGRVVAEGSLLAPSGEDPGPTRDPAGARRHDLDLEAVIEGDELVMRWRFHPARRSVAAVRALAEAARADLLAMIEACRAPEAGGYTPSDFPDVELDQDSLDSILAQVGGEIEDLGGER